MRRHLVLLAGLLAAQVLFAAKTLDLYFIDVEGGQATLIVTPAGQSVLVDAGWPGNEGRDATRIIAAAKKAGVKRIDYMLTTHYHLDHVGGVPQLAEKFPVVTFVDHGDNTETGRSAERLSSEYQRVMAAGKRLQVKAGDTLPLKDVDLRFVAARGETVKSGGAKNALCADAQRRADDASENARSIGFILSWGDRFRFVDLGDLTWNKELDLACPENVLGKVDLYLTTHHGLDQSGPAALVHAVAPRVAVMNNGARKGGSPAAIKIVRSSPGLEDLWQLHYAVTAGAESNAPDAFIANLDEACEGQWIRVSVDATGSFTVYNNRNKHQKAYARR
ncbi:MAG TPA: MBL fold metallo-hydrolase [Solibacterales bacterium]|nr:MBL fold metallo-hydrolase [Bryobacterales bacterium]